MWSAFISFAIAMYMYYHPLILSLRDTSYMVCRSLMRNRATYQMHDTIGLLQRNYFELHHGLFLPGLGV